MLGEKCACYRGRSRIGREIALKLAQAGANIAVCDVDLATAQSSASEIEKLGRKSLALKADVSKASDISEMVTAFLMNFYVHSLHSHQQRRDYPRWADHANERGRLGLGAHINLKSAFLCCKEASRHMMKARSGKIVNIASVVGIMGNAGQVNYSASKAGLIGLTKKVWRANSRAETSKSMPLPRALFKPP